MFPFFRKIRKRMADDNKPVKYARYAVGEIVLVVIGILIALQVNNWNTNRMQGIEEQKLLGKIRKEFIQNKKQLLDKIELRDLALASTKELLQLIDHKNSGTQDSKVDSLLLLPFRYIHLILFMTS